jgi:hypothetical protein
MKFYYKGKLIRTSKTRHYKYAIGCEAYGFSCSETLENAQRQLDQKARQCLATAKSNLSFSQDPKNLAWLKERYGEDFDPIEAYKKALELIKTLAIVELEEK